MKSLKFMIFALCVSMVTTSCNNTGKGAVIGAAGGAGVGAILGRIIGGDAKGAAIGAAIGGGVGAGTGVLIGRHMDKVKAQAEAVKNAQVESVTDANGLQGVKVTFDSGILFATNKADLNAASKSSLTQFANVLKTNNDCDIAIFGHTDSTGSDAVNNPLSEKRAASVQQFLLGQGVSSTQIKTVAGCGSKDPVADNSTAEGRKQNRRVEVFMYASEKMVKEAENGTLQ